MEKEVRALNVVKKEETSGQKLVEEAKREASKKIIKAKEKTEELWKEVKNELSTYERELAGKIKKEIDVEEKKMREQFQDINLKIKKNSKQNSAKMIKILLQEILKNGI